MTTTTIRVSEPRELLAYIPYRLGFRPRQSAVVVSLRGGRRRIGLVARVDLADLADPMTGPQVAEGLATHLWRDGAERVVLVGYDDAARTEGGWRTELQVALDNALDALEATIPETQVWVVDDARYYAFDCQDEACCPAAGRPLGDLEATQVSAQMVFSGASVAAHRGATTEVSPAPKGARYNVRRVARRWQDRRNELAGGAEGPGGGWCEELRGWCLESLDAWHAALAAAASDADLAARWLGRIDAGLHDTYVRDLIVTSAVLGPGQVPGLHDEPETLVRQRVGDAFDALFDPQDGLEPDAGRLGAAGRTLRSVMAHTSPDRHAPAATVLAVLAWWSGDGAAANDWLRRAFAVDPGYSFARLLASALEAGLPPGWARRAAARDAALR